jgi:hypothetical protein
MTQSRGKRWNPKPKAKQCPHCNREDSILTRPDKLGKNCATFADGAAAKAKEHVEGRKNAK